MQRMSSFAVLPAVLAACHATESVHPALRAEHATQHAASNIDSATPSPSADARAARREGALTAFDSAVIAEAARAGSVHEDAWDAWAALPPGREELACAVQLRAELQALIDEDPADATTFEILRWVYAAFHPRWLDRAQAMRTIERHHLEGEHAVELVDVLSPLFGDEVEALLAELAAHDVRPDVRVHARWQLAEGLLGHERLLEASAECRERWKWLDALGADRARELLAADRAALVQRARAELEAVVREGADVREDADLDDSDTLAELARRRLFHLDHLAPGRMAPELEGRDLDGRPFKLSDARGKVVVVLFWDELGPDDVLARLGQLAARTKDEPVEIVGVIECGDSEFGRITAARKRVWWRTLLDRSIEGRGALSESWSAEPDNLFVIDARGIVRRDWVCMDELDAVVDGLIAEARKLPK